MGHATASRNSTGNEMDIIDNGLVKFRSHSNPFSVSETYCKKPECDCNQVFFDLIEVSDSGEPVENPLSFTMDVDLDSWLENDPPSRPAEVAGFVDEFLGQCSQETRARIKEDYRDAKEFARHLVDFRLDPDKVQDGTLVAYPDILPGHVSISSDDGTAFSFRAVYQEREFRIVDLYCPNPTCDCQQAHVDFFELEESEDGPAELCQRFLGRVGFDGKLAVEETYTCTKADAKAVLAAWWQQGQVTLSDLKMRYNVVRDIGERTLMTSPKFTAVAPRASRSSLATSASIGESIEKPNKVGRNDPCPCGSGKKHKKCCLRKGPLPF